MLAQPLLLRYLLRWVDRPQDPWLEGALWAAALILCSFGQAVPPRAVLGSWVGARRLFHIPVFLTASRVVLPKILVLDATVLFASFE